MTALLQFPTPEPSSHKVDVEFSELSEQFCIRFRVEKSLDKDWCINKNHGNDPRKNWGLWETDVVECFLQARQNPQDITAPYLELQLSPLGQGFILWIKAPRKTYYVPLTDHLKVDFESQCNSSHWESKFYIKKDLFGQTPYLYGNFYACLGSPLREYWGLNFKDFDRLDFHRPESFIALK